VSSGPYAWLRNPIYAGDTLLLIGLAFITQSPSMLVYAATFMVAIDLFVGYIEEPSTAKRLGEVYRQYLEAVPRWLPCIRISKSDLPDQPQ
jgi:protein-S-isoprenylcysteine O-methyltransferase Ste14